MPTLSIDPNQPQRSLVAQAVEVLRAGGVVAYPTDTLYGLAVDPRNNEAVERLFDIKGRAGEMALPLIAATVEQADAAAVLTAADRRLADRFWPGPLTLVLEARAILPPQVVAGGTTIAVRVPAHPVARELAAVLGFCVTATSANRSGAPPCATAPAVAAALASSIDLLIDAGPSPGGPPSTIVELTTAGPRLVRAGAIAWERVLESLE